MAFHCLDCLQETMISGRTAKRTEPQCQSCYGDLYWGSREDFMRTVAETARKKLEASVGAMIKRRLPSCRN
jgi:hypothetical protein